MLLPLAVVLLALGSLLGGNSGVLGILGLIALAQGIGLGVAAGYLLIGHNPLASD